MAIEYYIYKYIRVFFLGAQFFGRIGNQVKILSGPATVSSELATFATEATLGRRGKRY